MRTIALLVVLSLSAPAPAAGGLTKLSVELGNLGQDMAVDLARQQVYVSVPNGNEIVIVSTVSGEIVERVLVGSRPHGVDLGLDGKRLYTALRGAGAVAVVDLATNQLVETIPVAEGLDSSLAFDVVEGRPGRLFVSANPGSGGFARIAMVKLDQANEVTTVASNRIIRADPTFATSPDFASLYIGEGFSPNSLFKLDITTDAAPIILEAPFGSVSGTTGQKAVNANGLRLYLTSGQVLRTGSLLLDGLVGSGLHAFELGGPDDVVYGAKTPNVIELHETLTYTKVGEVVLPCAFTSLKQLAVLPGGPGFLALGDDILCGMIDPGLPLPVLVDVVPARAKAGGAPTKVTLAGEFFVVGQVDQVRFGDQAARDVVILDDGTLTCTAPSSRAPGPVDVAVRGASGEAVLSAGFAYTPALVVHDFQLGDEAIDLEFLIDPGDAIFGLVGFGPPVASTLPGIQNPLALGDPVLLFGIPTWPFDVFEPMLHVPDLSKLAGLELVFQGLIVLGPASPTTAVCAFTNADGFVVGL